MKRLFWEECKKNQKTSGKGRKLCKFYEKLNEILGQRPASSPVKVVESMSQIIKHILLCEYHLVTPGLWYDLCLKKGSVKVFVNIVYA